MSNFYFDIGKNELSLILSRNNYIKTIGAFASLVHDEFKITVNFCIELWWFAVLFTIERDA